MERREGRKEEGDINGARVLILKQILAEKGLISAHGFRGFGL